MSDSWSIRLWSGQGHQVSLGIPRLSLRQAVQLSIPTRYQQFSTDESEPAPAFPAQHGAPEAHGPALGVSLPLENIGGVTVLRPMRRVPFVVTGGTMPAPIVERGMSWPSGLGAGVSLRFDDFGNFGVFGSLMNAPIVGDFSLGYAPPREAR